MQTGKLQEKPKQNVSKFSSSWCLPVGEAKERCTGKMDLNLHNSNQAGPWTNEKHLHFLNSLEAAFVRTMFEDNGRLLRLDRYLPDSSESTLDLKSQRPKNSSTSECNNIEGRRSRSVKRTKRLSSSYQSQPFDPSQDQVVPQLENRTSHKNERDHPIPNLEVAPVVPAN